MDELQQYATTWMTHRNIMLSQKSKSQKPETVWYIFYKTYKYIRKFNFILFSDTFMYD